MMKKDKISKFKFNKKKFFLLFLIGFFLLAAVVTGATLVGVGFSSFSQFLELKSYYFTLRPDLIGFDEYWNVYNNNAVTNGWTVANIEMFVIGIILLIIFCIALFVLIVLFLLRKTKTDNNLFSNYKSKNNNDVDKENEANVNLEKVVTLKNKKNK